MGMRGTGYSVHACDRGSADAAHCAFTTRSERSSRAAHDQLSSCYAPIAPPYSCRHRQLTEEASMWWRRWRFLWEAAFSAPARRGARLLPVSLRVSAPRRESSPIPTARAHRRRGHVHPRQKSDRPLGQGQLTVRRTACFWARISRSAPAPNITSIWSPRRRSARRGSSARCRGPRPAARLQGSQRYAIPPAWTFRSFRALSSGANSFPS